MKKVKFTLSLALSFLFLGAGLNSAYGQFPDELIPIYVLPNAPSPDVSEYQTSITYAEIVKPKTVDVFPTIPGIVLDKTYFDKWGILDFDPLNSGIQTISKERFNDYNAKFRIVVAFPYTGGKEKIASLSLTFRSSDTGNNLFGGLEFADNVTEKWKFFPSGTGTATYTYEIDLNKLFDQYPKITEIRFEIWLKDEIVRDPDNANGEGNGYVQVLRPYTLNLAEGITANVPISGYTPSGKNLKFEATVWDDNIGKNLLVTTDRALALGAPKYDKIGSGVENDHPYIKYEVTIPVVKSAINISINYASTPESGPTGNSVVITEDAVWGAAGAIYVTAANPGVVSVYNITGQLVKQEAVSGSRTLALPRGIYIVKLNGKATKVLL
jgi:hypothetical protein